MRRFINKLTGGDMWVADSRVNEYIAAGHTLAAIPDVEPAKKPEPVKVTVEEPAADVPVKRYTAKRRGKK
jgi:hypothetical protein